MMTDRISPEDPSSAPAIAVQQGDDGWHIRPADGDDQQDAEDHRHAYDYWKQYFDFRMEHEINRAGNGHCEQQKVNEILSFISDGALRQDFLQLSRSHQTAGKGQAAENDFHRQHRHPESRSALRSQIKFGGADEGDAQCAEGVAQSGPLRDSGHLHHAEGNADAAAEHEADGDPLVVDDAVMQQRASDGEHHADFAGPNAAARRGGRTHPLQRENKQRAGEEINKFDDVLASGELVHDFEDPQGRSGTAEAVPYRTFFLAGPTSPDGWS
jgi:hypothetical protein